MRRRPAVAVVALALAALVGAASPAFAHEELSPSSVGTGRPAFLTFTAANERQVAVTGVTLAPPPGLELGPVTRQPEGWTVDRSPTGVTWSGGSVAPGRFEQWGVELEAPDLPGTFTFRSTLRYADGRADTHEVPLTVSSATTPTTDPPAPGTTATPTAPTTLSAAPPPAATTAVGGADGGSARGRADLALGVGCAALLVGLSGLVLAARRPRAPRGPGRPPPTEQEW